LTSVTIRRCNGIDPSPLLRRVDAIRPRLGLPRRLRDDVFREHRGADPGGNRDPAGRLLGLAGTSQHRRYGDCRYSGIVAWFGWKVLGDQPALMRDPSAMMTVIKAKSDYLIGFAIAIAILYAIMIWMQKRAARRSSAH